jgi:CHASE3 domain sensor protein
MAHVSVQRFSIGAGAALLVIALFGAVAFAAVSRLATEQEAVLEANGVIAQLDQLLTASSDAEHAGAAYVASGTESALESFTRARGEVEDALDGLRSASEDRPRQRVALDSLGALVGQRFATINEAINARRRGGAAAAQALAAADTAVATRGGILPLLQRVRSEELVMLAEKTRLMSEKGRASKMVILIGSISAFLISALALSPIRPGSRGV